MCRRFEIEFEVFFVNSMNVFLNCPLSQDLYFVLRSRMVPCFLQFLGRLSQDYSDYLLGDCNDEDVLAFKDACDFVFNNLHNPAGAFIGYLKTSIFVTPNEATINSAYSTTTSVAEIPVCFSRFSSKYLIHLWLFFLTFPARVEGVGTFVTLVGPGKKKKGPAGGLLKSMGKLAGSAKLPQGLTSVADPIKKNNRLSIIFTIHWQSSFISYLS